MDKIIGIGGTGCAIADTFSKYPQYEIYKIDNDVTGENCYRTPQFSTPATLNIATSMYCISSQIISWDKLPSYKAD